MWNTMKKPNLIKGLDEEEEPQVNGIDQIFNKMMEEN